MIAVTSVARKARRAVMALTAAIAVGLAGAGGAGAQETSIEAIDEASSAHCSPCTVAIAGSSQLNAHVFGFEFQVSDCGDTLTAQFDEDGSGTMTASWTGTNCNVTACPGAEATWPMTGHGQTGPDTTHLTVRFCFVLSGGDPYHCDVELAVDEPADHGYRFVTDDETCPNGELTGSWATTAEQDTIELADPADGSDVEVVSEASGEHCEPCTVTVTGSSTLRAHVFGFEFEVSDCDDSMTVDFNEDGSGAVTSTAWSGANCNVVDCPSPEDRGSLTGHTGTGPNETHLRLRVCHVLSGADPQHCDAELTLEEDGLHEYRLVADDQACPASELTGSWSISGGQQIEVNPQPATPVEAVGEANGQHCDPCTVGLSGSLSIDAHSGGSEISVFDCQHAFTAVLAEDGTGSAVSHSLTGSSCLVTPCTGAEAAAPLSDVGEVWANVWALTMRLCFNYSNNLHCDMRVTVTETSSHDYRWLSEDQSCGSGGELSGVWGSTDDDLEIWHL